MQNAKCKLKNACRGFTLIELLVVITIIGILVSLLLPAVNSARESGRKAQCSNNLRQLGLACRAHEEAQSCLPTGGWGFCWVGDPSLGFGQQQPGGWLYSILPNLDQMQLYNLGGSSKGVITAVQMAGASQCISTPLSIMNCPTRRRARAYPCNWSGTGFSGVNYTPFNANPTANVARGDYAACVGDEADSNVTIDWEGPTSLSAGLALAAGNWQGYDTNGVIHLGSTVRLDDITDGTSNTYLLGEKYLVPQHYYNGNDGADNESMYTGCENDNDRTTYYNTPLQDHPGLLIYDCFGSAHATSCCFVFCDGSVHWISYSIDANTHHWLGNRHDGQTINLNNL